MKKYAKRLKEYDKIEFDPKEIIEGMSRLKGARRKPTSVALEGLEGMSEEQFFLEDLHSAQFLKLARR
jgi:hypothetical protein